MHRFCFILTLLFPVISYAQGWVQNGAHVQNDSAYIVVEGTNPNLTTLSTSTIKMTGPAQLKVQGDWTNNGSTNVFSGNGGTVVLHGNNQAIQGTTQTNFPSLHTAGSGTKTLYVNTLVGGGVGIGSGQLRLNNGNVIDLNSNLLTINNPNPNAIANFAGRGYILGETGPTPGYGEIEWRIEEDNGSSYVIPLGANLYFRFDVNNPGNAFTNVPSGIRVATYPTNFTPAINNRPLPSTVTNTNNEYGIENSRFMADRFWVINAPGYRAAPNLDVYLKHDNDLGGSNTIDEPYLGAVKWQQSNTDWSYPVQGTVNTAQDYVLLSKTQNYAGIWTLSDTTPCPIVDFTVSDSCELKTSFFADASTIETGGLASWNWNFSDGNQMTGPTAQNTFASAGSYLIKLYVVANTGCVDSLFRPLQIASSPIAGISYNDSCVNGPVAFTSNSSAPRSSISRTFWDFGNGNKSTLNTDVNYYTSSGIYPITLIVENAEGCSDTATHDLFIAPQPNANFAVDDVCEDDTLLFVDQSTTSSGSISAWNWRFDNGTSSAQQNPRKILVAGAHPTLLIVTNSYGCYDTIVKDAVVNPRALASFIFAPNEPKIFENTTFTSTSTNADSWEWFYGDGNVGFNEVSAHQYQLPGSYDVTLIANNAFNCPDTTTASLDVTSAPLYWLPNAFSPNSTENLNDAFGLSTPLTVEDYDLKIYNRWGELIFQSDNINKRWDGTYLGKQVPTGVYIYLLNFRDPSRKYYSYNGEIFINR